MKICSVCSLEKPVTGFHTGSRGKPQAKCKTCHNDYVRDWYQKDPKRARRGSLRFRYGMEISDYDTLLEKQDGKCCICFRSDRRFVVDHNHETGQVRGILCYYCNNGLGALEANWERAEQYLRQ